MRVRKGDKVIPKQIKYQCKNGEFWEIDRVYWDKKKSCWLFGIDDLKMWFEEDELEPAIDLEVKKMKGPSKQQLLKDDLNHCTEQLRRYSNVNGRYKKALLEIKMLAIHCDSDERAIQPYEILDIVERVLSKKIE